eukprot:COSAG02_NODE_1376_length_12993_cov_56.849542_7_plen_232_part_00
MPAKPVSARFLDEDDEWADREGLGWNQPLEEPNAVYAAGFIKDDKPRKRAPAREQETAAGAASPAAPARPGAAAAGGTDESEEAPITSEKELIAVFEAIDTDHSGSITAAELNNVLRRYVHKHVMQEEVQKLVDKADKDRDGKVNLEEFLQIIRGGAVGGLAGGDSAQDAQPAASATSKRTSKRTQDYQVTITTGTGSGGGTDANVWVQLFGTTGVSEKQVLGGGEGRFED